LGFALMPTLAWLTVARNRPLRWRIAGAVVCAGVGAYAGLTALFMEYCFLTGSCL
jgi:hypothetical protein